MIIAILAVSHQPTVLELLKDLLVREGCMVFTAQDAVSSLKILKKEKIHMVIVDSLMPTGEGKALCQILRRSSRLKTLFLVLLTTGKPDGYSEYMPDLCIPKEFLEKISRDVLRVFYQLQGYKSVGTPSEYAACDETFGSEGDWWRSIEKRFYALLENLPEGVIEITDDYKIVYANSSAQSLTGLPEEDILASDILRLFDAKDRRRVEMLLKETVQSSRVIAEHSSVRLKDNEIIITIVPIEGDQNHILILNDVSERKRMEAQLNQAQKMEAVGTLAAGIAHDFNNLLMGIQGNTSLILFNSDVNNPHLEKLKTIEKQVESGSRLTKQLLGYGRTGRYESAHIDLNELLKETSEIFSHARKEFVICRDFADDLHYLEADRGQIEQVLMNLYINATDAMSDGGILSLETKNTTDREMTGRLYSPKPGGYVLLKVSDTGVGMDEETIKRIFDPFFTTKEMGRGTGLGLASVYGIVKGHGGYIDVQSAPGKGTEISLYFPAARGAAPGRMRPIEKGEVLFGSEGVLLVDDEEVIRNVGREMLEALGYRVFLAENGEEALRVYEDCRKDIHIVLLDMVMPRMGGGEVYDRLKNINQNIVVLLSSGYSIDGEAEDILKRGCSGFIQKPFKIGNLSQKMRTLLRKSEENDIVCGDFLGQPHGRKDVYRERTS